MPKDQLLNQDQVNAALSLLPDWTYDDGSISRTWETGGWRATLMLVNLIGWVCETGFHHPDLGVHYSKVIVTLSTHSAGGVTAKDLATAERLERAISDLPEDGSPLGTPPEPLIKPGD